MSDPPTIRAGVLSRWAVPLACIVFAAVMALASRGFLEPDEITHFLYARAVWHDWRNLVNIWGRLGCTGLFALAAPAGMAAARLLAVAVMALTAAGTAQLLKRILENQNIAGHKASTSFIARHAAAFTWLLLFAQPAFLLNSFTLMTEMPLACAWVWAAVMLLRGANRPDGGLLAAGAVLGLGGLMRPEGWVAVAVWPVLAFLWMRWARPQPRALMKSVLPLIAASTAVAGLPSLVWYLLGAAAWHSWDWFIAAWPWSPASQYGRSGGIFLISSIVALAVWMWVPVIAGAHLCWKARRGGGRIGLFLLVLPLAGFFALHATLGTLGLFGSLSLPRYFVCVSPMLAALALIGLIRMEPPGRGKTFRVVIIGMSLFPLATLAAFGYLPMQPTTEQRRLDVAIHAVQQRGGLEPIPLVINHPYALLQLGRDPDSPAHVRAASRDAIAGAPAGTLLVADSTVWSYENRPTAEELIAWGYVADLAVAGQVDAIPDRAEPLTFHPDPAARVRLWIKH